MHRTTITLAATGLLAVAALAGCSSSSDTAASASAAASVVGGTTTCDDATITQAINDAVSAEDSAMKVTSLDNLVCADGWAAAEATVSNGADNGGIAETFIFEAEGQFWVPKDPAAVCGTMGDDMTQRPDDAQVADPAWQLGCTTN